MKSKHVATVATRFDGIRVHFQHSHHPSAIAEFAMRLLETPGSLSLGKVCGEDSAGRKVYVPYEPAEVVQRALDISEAFFAEAGRRELLIEIPPYTEAQLATLQPRE